MLKPGDKLWLSKREYYIVRDLNGFFILEFRVEDKESEFNFDRFRKNSITTRNYALINSNDLIDFEKIGDIKWVTETKY